MTKQCFFTFLIKNECTVYWYAYVYLIPLIIILFICLFMVFFVFYVLLYFIKKKIQNSYLKIYI